MCGDVHYHLACKCIETRFKYCDKATKKGTAKGTVNVPCGSGKPPGDAEPEVPNKCKEFRGRKPFDPTEDPSHGKW